MEFKGCDVKGKKALVIGMARSGAALAKVLVEQGAAVTAYDAKSGEKMEPIRQMLGDTVTWALGGDAMALVEKTDLVFISPGVPIGIAPLERARELGIPVIGEVEYASRVSRAPLAAITGTNGKTTTTALLGHIMELTKRKTFVVGNIGIPFISIAQETTPDDVVVAEISSFQMETADEFHPRAAAVLNISEDHLNRHGTMQVYIDCKARIFERMRGDDCVVLNADEPMTRALAERVKCRLAFFSRKERVENGACVVDGKIALMHGGVPCELIEAKELRIPGGHNLENALAAAVLADAMGAQKEAICEGLRTFPGVEHRIEPAGQARGVTFINDSKGTNCDATLRATHAMDRPTILLLGGYDKGSDYKPVFEDMPETIRAVVALGATKQRVVDNAKECGYAPVVTADSFEEAVRTAFEMAKPGENVLLSPASASFDMFDDYEQRGRVFKALAKQIAEETK